MAIEFAPALEEFLNGRVGRRLTVLSGPNNSGKSLVLKHLKRNLGLSAYMMGAVRFYHVYHFQSGLRDPAQVQQFETQFLQQFAQPTFNHEANFLDLQAVVTGLTDVQRGKLFELCGELLGNKFTLKKVEEDNELSIRYIDMDGQNLSVGSTGARLLITMLGICMDGRFTSLLIDEPELGLSPRVQQALARVFEEPDLRREHFPHLEHVYLATHSHLFLARAEIQDNFVVAKEGDRITLSQVRSPSEFHKLQFNLLGNSLESLFLPAAIVIVEGKTDRRYLERVLQLKLPTKRLTAVGAEGNVKRKVNELRSLLGGSLDTSPFRDRLFVVLDSVHQAGLVEDLVSMGVPPGNVIEWSRNGIEFLYPSELMARTFACGPERVDELEIADDVVRLNGVSRTKAALCEEIVGQLDSDVALPEELEMRLIEPLRQAID